MEPIASFEALIKYIGSMNALTFLGIAFVFMLWQAWRFFTKTLYPEWVPWCKTQVEQFISGWSLLVQRASQIDDAVKVVNGDISAIKGTVLEIQHDQKKILDHLEQMST